MYLSEREYYLLRIAQGDPSAERVLLGAIVALTAVAALRRLLHVPPRAA